MSPVEDHGEFTVAVENGMLVMKHTQGAVNDTFSIVDGVLTATSDDYSLDYPNVKVESSAIACTLTSSMFVYTAVPTQGYRFTYNSDGLRVKKEFVKGGYVLETTDYTLHGKLVTEMRKGQDVLHFFYDAQGRVSMAEWNGEVFSYVHNLQGDIVAIVDSCGAKVVEYRYDAWGKEISRTLTSEDIGKLNPFRYRGYVYDEETELYYLRSRYYDPEIGRFISEDPYIRLTICGFTGYAYCHNTPSVMADTDGNSGYYVVLNLYDPKTWGKPTGHADFSIIAEGNENIVCFSDGKNDYVGTDVVFSYGSPGILYVRSEGPFVEPSVRLIIYSDVDIQELKSFFSWLFDDFVDNNRLYSEKYSCYSYQVIDSSFNTYTYGENNRFNSYCLTVAVYLISMIGIFVNKKNGSGKKLFDTVFSYEMKDKNNYLVAKLQYVVKDYIDMLSEMYTPF